LRIYGEAPAETEEKKDGFVVKGDGALTASAGGPAVYKQEGHAGVLCDRTFIEAAMAGEPNRVRSTYRDALRSLAFTMACNMSMESGAPVKVDDLLKGIRRAASNNETMVLYSHDIQKKPSGIGMKTEWLEAILKAASEEGMAIVGFNDLP
jgi:hypothetical protein